MSSKISSYTIPKLWVVRPKLVDRPREFKPSDVFSEVFFVMGRSVV